MRIRWAPSRNPGDCLHVPYSFAERSTEEAINDWISSWIERCQTLYESSDRDIRLSFWYMPINLKKIENYVRTPAKNKYSWLLRRCLMPPWASSSSLFVPLVFCYTHRIHHKETVLVPIHAIHRDSYLRICIREVIGIRTRTWFIRINRGKW